MARVGSTPPRGAAAARTSDHSRARGTGNGEDEGARGGGRQPRPSGLARQAPARARHLASGRDCVGTGCGPPGAGATARCRRRRRRHRRRPSPGGATPPGTAAARPPRRTRGDTAWLVSRVSGNALCTGLRDGYATTERNARRIDRSSVAHARLAHN